MRRRPDAPPSAPPHLTNLVAAVIPQCFSECPAGGGFCVVDRDLIRKFAVAQQFLNTLRRICPAYHLGRTKIARGISGCNMDTIVPVPCGKPAVIRNQAVAAVVKSFQKCRAIL